MRKVGKKKIAVAFAFSPWLAAAAWDLGLVPLCSLLIWEVVEERMDKGVVMVLGLEKKVLLVVNLHV